MTLKHVLNLFSKTEVQEDKTHPNHLSQTILNRLFGRVLKREGVNVSCAKHTEKHLFTYLPIHLFTFKKAAFTLAEVLITLGIIGVVAALTLPTLIKNYQKQVYVNQLKVAYSTLEQGFKKMLADEGVDSLSDIPEFANINPNHSCLVGESYTPNCIALTDKLQKYFKFTVLIPVGEDDLMMEYLGSFSDPYYMFFVHVLRFSNNFWICLECFSNRQPQNLQLVKDLGGHLTDSVGYIWLDVNGGNKGPNKVGRDVFNFSLGSNGNLYPDAGADSALFWEQTPLESNTMYWRNDSGFCGDPNSSNIDGALGEGCAARIIENGWKMDY